MFQCRLSLLPQPKVTRNGSKWTNDLTGSVRYVSMTWRELTRWVYKLQILTTLQALSSFINILFTLPLSAFRIPPAQWGTPYRNPMLTSQKVKSIPDLEIYIKRQNSYN